MVKYQLVIVQYVIEKKPLTVSNNTIQAGSLGDFFKNLGKKRTSCIKKMTNNVINNPRKAMDITANIATAAATRISKKILKTLTELITFQNTGRGFYLAKFIGFYTI